MKAVLIHRKKGAAPQPEKKEPANEQDLKAKRGGVIAENKKEGEEALSGKKSIKILARKYTKS